MQCPSDRPATRERKQGAATTSHDFAEGVLHLVNNARSQAGVPPLRLSRQLMSAAQAHSADMARHRQMSHTGSDGSSASDRLKRAGYRGAAIAENVAAAGQSSVAAVVADWLQSPGHRKNMLNGAYQESGVGYVNGYWTQTFGRPGR